MIDFEPFKDMAMDIYTWMTAAAAVVLGYVSYVKTLYAEATKDWSDRTRKLVGIGLGLAAFLLFFTVATKLLA